jgi:GDPmannose 4,6-dehydratase
VVRSLFGTQNPGNIKPVECFSDTSREKAIEDTPFKPPCPDAVAKAAAFWQMTNYREAYGLFACKGILASHESPHKPNRIVTQ